MRLVAVFVGLALGALGCSSTDESQDDFPDAAVPDLGAPDLGPPDLGPVDTGVEPDAGAFPDADTRARGELLPGEVEVLVGRTVELELRLDGMMQPADSADVWRTDPGRLGTIAASNTVATLRADEAGQGDVVAETDAWVATATLTVVPPALCPALGDPPCGTAADCGDLVSFAPAACTFCPSIAQTSCAHGCATEAVTETLLAVQATLSGAPASVVTVILDSRTAGDLELSCDDVASFDLQDACYNVLDLRVTDVVGQPGETFTLFAGGFRARPRLLALVYAFGRTAGRGSPSEVACAEVDFAPEPGQEMVVVQAGAPVPL